MTDMMLKGMFQMASSAVYAQFMPPLKIVKHVHTHCGVDFTAFLFDYGFKLFK